MNVRGVISISVIAGFIAFSGYAMADHSNQPPFSVADIDQSGGLDQAEYEGTNPGWWGGWSFQEGDANSDNVIDPEEYHCIAHCV